MSQAQKIFVPAYPYSDGPERGLFSPFEPGVRTLPAGYRAAPQFRALPVDIVFEKDVAVTLRDGVTIYTDVFRPAGSERVPAIVAWSPYGKSQGTAPRIAQLYAMLGMRPDLVSGLEKWEGPDPAYWCAHGYAVCNPDARGVAHSQGDSVMFGRQEGQDCHDVVEWLATQPWCSGKVAMSGTSYLSIAQWFTAAEQPPHLTVINPWEGFSDAYRDLVMRGGMPDLSFAELLQHNYAGKQRREDIVAEAKSEPLVNVLWEDKIVRFDKIDIPAYVVASYSNTLHTAGTFRAWRRIASREKWLRIHNTLEWPDYYDEAHKDDLRCFFDHYLKGEANGWEETPRVRYAVLDLQGGDRLSIPAHAFPPAEVTSTKYYLDAGSRTLSPEACSVSGTATYDTQSDTPQVSFVVRFEKATEIVGYPKLRLWVEAKDANDMDLFAFIQKLDVHGNHLQQFTAPADGARMQDLTEHSASVLRYKGSNGRLRVSARRLDPVLSTDEIPAHTFDRVEKLSPGQIVDVEIDMFPMGMVFRPGEQLRLMVSSRNAIGAIMPGIPIYRSPFGGHHIIHSGGEAASFLQLPVSPIHTS